MRLTALLFCALIATSVPCAYSTSTLGRVFRSLCCSCCCCCSWGEEDSPRRRSWSGASTDGSTRALNRGYGSLADEYDIHTTTSRSPLPETITTTTTTTPSLYVSSPSSSEGDSENFESEIFTNFSNLINERDSKIAEYIPQVDGRYERTQNTMIGTVVLGEVVGTSSSSIVFNLDSHPGYVIKYTTDCLERDKTVRIHPLLRDYLFLSSLNPERKSVPQNDPAEIYIDELRGELVPNEGRRKIAPRPILVSPGIPHSARFASHKVAFKLSRSVHWRTCVEMNASVRYMIMEKVRGQTLDYWQRETDGGISVRTMTAIGVHLINTIRYLDSLGIFHNDIHAGNIIPEKDGIILIDFGRAKFIDLKSRGKPQMKTGKFGVTWSDALNSPWEIEGYQQSVRDDLYKAFEVMAIGMVGKELLGSMRHMEYRNLLILHAWKSSRNIFATFPGQKSVATGQITGPLGRLLDLVRSVTKGNQIDIFDQLISGLQDVYSLAKSHNI